VLICSERRVDEEGQSRGQASIGSYSAHTRVLSDLNVHPFPSFVQVHVCKSINELPDQHIDVLFLIDWCGDECSETSILFCKIDSQRLELQVANMWMKSWSYWRSRRL
jgi:hypothetical protein